MNKLFLAIGTSAALMLLTGCAATTTIHDPDNTNTNVRQEGSVSAEEMIQAARFATRNAMTNAKFINFLKIIFTSF